MEKSAIKSIARLLVFVGAVNWGLVGIGYFMNADYNVVEMLLGSIPVVVAVVYVLIGASALYLVIPGKK